MSEQLVDRRGELVLTTRELVVVLLLESRAALADVEVAKRVREQATLRIGAEVALGLAAADALVAREHAAVAGADQAARMTQLLEQLAPVVRVVLQALRLEHGPARRERDQHCEQQDEQAEEVADLRVHAT